MYRTLSFLFFLALAFSVAAENSIPLWPDGAPGALGKEDKDTPTLTLFPLTDPAGASAAVVILPGGGYGGLADYEGKDYAQWLVTNGVAGFVLKYRLGSAGYRHPRMIEDAARAVRLVRANAVQWKIDPKRVGIMGSSAGGHLASTLLTHFDKGNADSTDPVEHESSRPDLGVLCYPVISMGANAHHGSRENLLGTNPSPALVAFLSSELQVTPETPPCFIWHTWQDTVVKVENSLDFAAALRRANVPFELHVYENGAHGLALAPNHPWPNDCIYWLKGRGFVK